MRSRRSAGLMTPPPARRTNSSENSPLKTGSAQPVSVTSRSSARPRPRARRRPARRSPGCARRAARRPPPRRMRRCPETSVSPTPRSKIRARTRSSPSTRKNDTLVRFGNSSLCSIGGPMRRQVQLLEPVADLDHALRVADADVLELELAPVRDHRRRARRRRRRGSRRSAGSRAPSRPCTCAAR